MAQFTQESVLGAKIPRIVPPKARRLTSKVQRIRKKYIEDLEEMFKKTLTGFVAQVQGTGSPNRKKEK